MAFFLIATSLCLGTIWAAYKFITSIALPPSHFPKNIPTIPFYFTLLSLFKEVDQEQLYHEYLKAPLDEHGAVNIFFGGHWNVLITRPSHMAQVLKNDEDFPKAGNQVKNPSSVLALYTGENIISAAGGQTWRHFVAITKPALQADIDESIIVRNVGTMLGLLLRDQRKSQSGTVAVAEHVQACAIANVSESLLGSRIDALAAPSNPLLQLQREIKPKIFNPFHLNFPLLDRLPIPSRRQAKRLVSTFHTELTSALSRGHDHKCDGASTNLGCRLLSAHAEGRLSDYHLRQNTLIAFVAGHENPMILTLSTLFVLATRPALQSQLRAEVASLPPSQRTSPDALASLPLLNAVIYETLRLYPPLSQIMNKITARTVALSPAVVLAPGTYTGYNCYATNRDAAFWGPDAAEFRPARWGGTAEAASALLRRATSKAAFVTFHGGKRACLGQRWALAAHRVTMAELLGRVRWALDEGWEKRMTPAGPLMPKNLRLRFEEISDEGVPSSASL